MSLRCYSRLDSVCLLLLLLLTVDGFSPSVPEVKAPFTLRASTAVDDFLDSQSPKGSANVRDDGLPWTDAQEWALTDHLPKYTVPISLDGNPARSYVLWNAMTRDVVELSGYSPKPELCALPLLDDYAFVPAGGVSGIASGLPGVADGTRIETSRLSQVERTLPRGYVRTADGSAAYELGEAKADEPEGTLVNYLLSSTGSDTATEDPNAMLVRLGATTGCLLAGATAMNMLSHHLTVNVFWV